MSEPAREAWEISSTGEWLDRRRQDVTASRIACLFDLHPYMTRAQMADIMRGATGTGTASVPDSPAMRRGRILEPAVAAALAEERPELNLTRATAYYRVPSWRLGCTPDYLCGDEGIVECKTVSREQWDRWHGKPPIGYTLQLLTQLMVTGRRWGLLACLEVSPSYPLHVFDVPRHEAAERRILDAVREWWAEFDAGRIAGSAPAAELEAELDDGSVIDLSSDNEMPGILDERAALKATTSDAEKRLKELDYQIKNRMGRASRAWLPGWNISFATQHRREAIIPARDIRVLRVRAVDEHETGDVTE